MCVFAFFHSGSVSSSSIVQCPSAESTIIPGSTIYCTVTVVNPAGQLAYGTDDDFDISVTEGSVQFWNTTDHGQTWLIAYTAPKNHAGIIRHVSLNILVHANQMALHQSPIPLSIAASAASADQSELLCSSTMIASDHKLECVIIARTSTGQPTTFAPSDTLFVDTNDHSLGTIVDQWLSATASEMHIMMAATATKQSLPRNVQIISTLNTQPVLHSGVTLTILAGIYKSCISSCCRCCCCMLFNVYLILLCAVSFWIRSTDNQFYC